MELFEEIRREYRFGAGTIQGVAKTLKTHRRMVRQALASAIPPERKTPARSSPKAVSYTHLDVYKRQLLHKKTKR